MQKHKTDLLLYSQDEKLSLLHQLPPSCSGQLGLKAVVETAPQPTLVALQVSGFGQGGLFNSLSQSGLIGHFTTATNFGYCLIPLLLVQFGLVMSHQVVRSSLVCLGVCPTEAMNFATWDKATKCLTQPNV